MAVRLGSPSLGAGVLALLACVLAAPARAGNVLYNFNSWDGGWTVTSGTLTQPEKPWTWIQGPSVEQGGWQAWRGADAFQSAPYPVSPLLVVDDQDGSYVRVDIRHRFDFGGTGTTPLLALGQVQYQVNDGDWLGIRTLDFGTTSGKIAPSYPSPPFPFIDQTLAPPTGTYAVDAWYETTNKFVEGDHQDSQFELNHQPVGPYTFGPGDLIRFRFLVATQTPLSGTGAPVIDWEINRVQIDGVRAVPEPATLALAGIGALGCLLLVQRRRSTASRAVARSTAATIVVVIVIATVVAAPVRAESTWWNFQQNDGDWTASQAREVVAPSSAHLWTWVTSSTVTGGTTPHWYVIPQGVNAISPSVSWLTSPVFSGPVGTSATTARISIAQSFLLKMGTSGRPIATGQLEYQLNGGEWVGLPLSAFTNGGSVLVDDPIYGASPFKSGSATLQFVNQASYVAPNYLTPTGTAALPFISPGAAAFTGTTPGFSTAYVPSQAFLATGTIAIESLQLRFSQLNLASTCGCGDGWNLRYVQVDFPEVAPPVPEPSTLALGACGLAAVGAAGVVRRRRHQRASRPSESP